MDLHIPEEVPVEENGGCCLANHAPQSAVAHGENPVAM